MKLNFLTKKEKAVKEKKTEKEKKPKKEKKPHDDAYVLKKNTVMRILRIALWVMLIFVFIRGLVDIFKPDNDQEVKQLIRDFKEDFSEFSNQNAEVMSFAQNFVREYLTYD